MTHLDLTQEEDEALATALRRIIADDRYPLSPRVQMLKDILAKLSAEPVGEKQRPSKVYAPLRATATRRRGGS